MTHVLSQAGVRKPLDSKSRGPGAGGGVESSCAGWTDADRGADDDGGNGGEGSGDGGGGHDGLGARLPLGLKPHE